LSDRTPITAPSIVRLAPLLALAGCGALSGLFGNIGGIGGGQTQVFPRRVAWQGAPITTAATSVVRPVAVVAVDINLDGLVDVVAAFEGSMVQPPSVDLFLQSRSGGQLTWPRVTIGQGPNLAGVSAVAVGDVNLDGRADVVAACNARIVYLRSPQDPTAALQWQSSTIAQSDAAGLGRWRDVAIAQVDNLFGPDIVACNESPGLLSFFQAPMLANDGFGWVRFDIDGQTRAGAAALLLSDLNGDGRPDIISSAPGEANARIAWYRHPGGTTIGMFTGTFSRFVIGNERGVARLALGDLNRDGRADLVCVNSSEPSAADAGDGRRIGWYERPADPTASWVGHVLARFTANTPTDAAVADVDVNGNPDVIVSTRQAGTLRWFTRRDDVRQTWIENNLADLNAGAVRLAPADIDLDARPDVIAALSGDNGSADGLGWFLNPE